MLLEKYKAAGLLFNSNFLEGSTTSGLSAYRGELVLIEGEVADTKGHAKPPVEVMRGVALLADTQLRFVLGALDDVAFLPAFVEKYKADFAPDMKALMYIVNIQAPVQVEIKGINFVLIPLIQGVPWNELIEEVRLDKSDFKGLSAADKVVKMVDELQSYKPKYPAASLDDVLVSTIDVKRQGWGAI
jgi:hypothetical protein